MVLKKMFQENTIEKILIKLHNRNLLFLISIIWIAVLFSSWDVRQFLSIGEHINKLTYGDYWILSNHTSWLSLSNEISRGNIFLNSSLLNYEESGLRFFPYLSLWFSGLLIYIFGESNTLLISSILFPTLSYIFLTLIYQHYLSWRWSISFAALGVLGFSSIPFRDFLLELITNTESSSVGFLNSPDILDFPFPSISLLLFLIVFYLSIKRKYMSKKRAIALSVLWGIQSQVHIINIIFGIPFWLGLLALRMWRSNENHWSTQQSRQLLINFGVILVICIPMLVSIFTNPVQSGGLELLSGTSERSFFIDWLVYYFLMPLVVLGIVYSMFRIDPYELLFKFLPVWVAMLVELLLVLTWELLGVGISSELLFSRVGLFFLHIFYFVPAIYYMHREHIPYYSGTEALPISNKVRSFLIWFFKDASLLYLPLFVIFLSSFSISLSEKSFDFIKNTSVPIHQNNQRTISLVTNNLQYGDLVVGPNNLTNISIMSKGEYNTLWSNRVISTLDEKTVIDRFALYAKLIGWSEKEFLLFMLPSNDEFKYSNTILDLSSPNAIPGLGYWMTYNNKEISIREKNSFSTKLRNLYNSTNIMEKLMEYNVKRIVVLGQPEYIKTIDSRVDGEYSVFDLVNKL